MTFHMKTALQENRDPTERTSNMPGAPVAPGESVQTLSGTVQSVFKRLSEVDRESIRKTVFRQKVATHDALAAVKDIKEPEIQEAEKNRLQFNATVICFLEKVLYHG